MENKTRSAGKRKFTDAPTAEPDTQSKPVSKKAKTSDDAKKEAIAATPAQPAPVATETQGFGQCMLLSSKELEFSSPALQQAMIERSQEAQVSLRELAATLLSDEVFFSSIDHVTEPDMILLYKTRANAEVSLNSSIKCENTKYRRAKSELGTFFHWTS